MEQVSHLQHHSQTYASCCIPGQYILCLILCRVFSSPRCHSNAPVSNSWNTSLCGGCGTTSCKQVEPSQVLSYQCLRTPPFPTSLFHNCSKCWATCRCSLETSVFGILPFSTANKKSQMALLLSCSLHNSQFDISTTVSATSCSIATASGEASSMWLFLPYCVHGLHDREFTILMFPPWPMNDSKVELLQLLWPPYKLAFRLIEA